MTKIEYRFRDGKFEKLTIEKIEVIESPSAEFQRIMKGAGVKFNPESGSESDE